MDPGLASHCNGCRLDPSRSGECDQGISPDRMITEWSLVPYKWEPLKLSPIEHWLLFGD